MICAFILDKDTNEAFYLMQPLTSSEFIGLATDTMSLALLNSLDLGDDFEYNALCLLWWSPKHLIAHFNDESYWLTKRNGARVASGILGTSCALCWN